MSESSAQSLFRKLRALKDDPTPGVALLCYCKEALGSLEPLHFDYKEKRDRRDALLHDDDKRNIAKAVSGFANSDGGVLIWGIKDATIEPKPITNIGEFMGKVQDLAGNCVTPKVTEIDAAWLPDDPENPSCGFGLLYIPQSALPPHQVLLKLTDVQNHYFVRSSGSFCKASHYQLEDMFGRRPKPILKLHFCDALRQSPNDWRIRLELRNDGKGTARLPILLIDCDDVVVPGTSSPKNLICEKTHVFKPNGMIGRWDWQVIHPCMCQTVAGMHFPEDKRSSLQTVKIRYKIFAENMIPYEDILEFPFPELTPV